MKHFNSKKAKVTVTPIFYTLNLCENLNLAVRPDLVPSIGSDIISLKGELTLQRNLALMNGEKSKKDIGKSFRKIRQ